MDYLPHAGGVEIAFLWSFELSRGGKHTEKSILSVANDNNPSYHFRLASALTEGTPQSSAVNGAKVD